MQIYPWVFLFISEYYSILWIGFLGFHGGSEGKASACDAGDPGSIPGSGRSPGEENGNSSALAWRIHGWRSLVGCSPRGHKESDTTEWLHFHFHFLFIHCPFDLHLCSLFPLTLCVIFSDSSRNNIYLQLLTVYLQNVMLIHGQCKILKSRIPYSSTHSLYSFFYSFLQYVL